MNTFVTTVSLLLISRIIYSRYSGEMDEIIIMAVLRYEGLFSFAGSGLVNAALVFGSQPEIGQVHFLFRKRLIVLAILFLLLSVVVYILFNIAYALSVFMVPIALAKYYLRNLIISLDKIGLMNICVLITSFIYLLLVYIVDSIALLSLAYAVVLVIDVFLFRLVTGRLLITEKVESKVRINVRENLKQGLASAALNNLDKLLFANVVTLDLLPTFDLATKLKGVYSKTLSSIWNIYLPKLNDLTVEKNYRKTNNTLFILTWLSFVLIWFGYQYIGWFFQIKEIHRNLLILVLFPVFFSFVLFKARLLNARTENLHLVTIYRIMESFIKSIIVPVLVLYLGILAGLKYGMFIYFLAILFFIFRLRNFIEVRTEIIMSSLLLILYICFVL